MSRRIAITLAVFTAWPLIYALIFFGTMFVEIMSIMAGPGHRLEPPIVFWIIVPLHFLTMLEIVILLVIYIRHLFKTDRVPQDKKAVWAVILFLGNMIAMPVYWHLYIWREQVPRRAGTTVGNADDQTDAKAR